ncbi:integrase arm-type DNA-binding domain-containing protein [Sulfuricurvum sp.]|uniref:tyrosine-type recombinase/integrase n=1 Tax=Sulfuricurvum sp. TaxID=2025608 RepID=UPI0026180B23|nr:integrase arm-type DNA-binding domain-containing protein [Sulfuricurvum sp.]MDD3597190.1 integrase arm-type DNA-binding domain-containing protein [Sulfuricurvum sp.]
MANKKVAPLTDTEIKKFKPNIEESKDYTKSDGNGLQLLVKLDGRKIWEIRYTINGKAKKTTLGTYPTVSLAKARAIRDEYKRKSFEGIDPIDERKKSKKIIAEKEAVNQAMSEGQFHKVAYGWLNSLNDAESTHKKRLSSFENDIFPFFCTYDKHKHIVSSKHINDIKHPELLKVLTEKEKTAPVVANRRFIDCKRLWRYAINHGHTEINTPDRISIDAFKKHEVKHRPKITDEKVLGEMLRAIDSYKGEGGIIVRNVLRLTALTMLRIGNLATLKWNNIYFKKGVIIIKRSEMKVKDKNLPDFVLPLSRQAIEILKETKELTGWGEWVFHGIKDSRYHVNKESGNKALRKMGFTDEENGRKQTLHSFRGTYASLARTHHKDHGAVFEALERVLDHQEGNQVVRAYAHMADYTEQMRELLQWWADFLDELKDREY